MEAGQGVAKTMGVDELVQHGEISPISVHGGCWKCRQKTRNTFGENLFNTTKEGVFRDGWIGERRSEGSVYL